MSTEDRQDLLANVGTERRDFLKKIAIAAAFATPTIATFSLDGMGKKAFAQAAYDPPEVIALASVAEGRAVVTFSQPMDTGAATDMSRGILGCRQTWLENGEDYSVTWSGNTHQVITFTGCWLSETTTLHVSYNESGCETSKFKGLNGLDLLPWSGSVTVSGVPC